MTYFHEWSWEWDADFGEQVTRLLDSQLGSTYGPLDHIRAPYIAIINMTFSMLTRQALRAARRSTILYSSSSSSSRISATRGMSISAVCRLKETDRGECHVYILQMLQMLRQSIGTVADNLDLPNLAETREKHKQDQLRKQKEGHGEWKAELASDSEEAVGSYS